MDINTIKLVLMNYLSNHDKFDHQQKPTYFGILINIK